MQYIFVLPPRSGDRLSLVGQDFHPGLDGFLVEQRKQRRLKHLVEDNSLTRGTIPWVGRPEARTILTPLRCASIRESKVLGVISLLSFVNVPSRFSTIILYFICGFIFFFGQMLVLKKEKKELINRKTVIYLFSFSNSFSVLLFSAVFEKINSVRLGTICYEVFSNH